MSYIAHIVFKLIINESQQNKYKRNIICTRLNDQLSSVYALLRRHVEAHDKQLTRVA